MTKVVERDGIRIETQMEMVIRELGELRADAREIRQEMNRKFYWVLGVMIAMFGAVFGMIFQVLSKIQMGG